MSTEALCFDMYGTLCDTSSVTAALADELTIEGRMVDDIDELWRQKQLQYSYQLALMEGAYETFWNVTDHALDYALAYYDVDADRDERDVILDAYNHLNPFSDTLDALAAFQDAGFEVTVLSNGNPEMLETLAANTGIDEHVDDMISAHEVETFKPNPRVYRNAADRLDRDVGDCRLVSSNAWDVAGASWAGMATAWVDRYDEPFERIGGDPDLIVDSLADLADELA